MNLTLDSLTKTAQQSLFSQSGITLPPFSFEDTPLGVSIVDLILNPVNARIWQPRDMTGYSVRAAIGNAFLSPIAGTGFILSGTNLTAGLLITGKRYQILTYVAGDVFTNVGAGSDATDVIFTATGTTPTTWTNSSVLQEISANVAYDASASDLQTALNATGWISTAGGVTVTGSGQFFFVTFTTAGAQAQMTGDGTEFAPLSFVETAVLVTGSATVQSVQSIRFLQQPAAYAVLATDSTAPGATVTVVATGGGGLNAKVRVTFNAQPYDGKFSITVAGLESALISWNAAGADVQTALENIQITSGTVVTGRKYKIVNFVTSDDFTNIGGTNVTGNVFVATGTTPTTWTHGSVLSPVAAGNVAVSQEQIGSYLIGFQGDMANTDMGTITSDGTGLLVQSFKSGILSSNTEAMELLLGANQSVVTSFEIEATPMGGNPVKLYHVPVTVIAPLIHGTNVSGPVIYFYDKAQIDALLLLKANLASPTFTGTPAAPTATPGDDTTLLATTAFVAAAIAAFAADGSSFRALLSSAGVTPMTDGTYQMGIGGSQNGTFTIVDGVVTGAQNVS